MIKVSVLMPSWNASSYIEAAIESVLSQHFSSFELLILDDASTDRTKEILRRYRRNRRIRIFRNRKRSGATAALSKLLSLSSGKYVSLCDADDLMLPMNLKRLSSVLDEDRHVGIVFGDSLLLRLGANHRLNEILVTRSEHLENAWDIVQPPIRGGGSMLRRSSLVAAGGFDTSHVFLGHADVYFRITELSEARYLQGEVHYVYRKHMKSTSRSKTFETHVRREADRLFAEVFERRYGRDFAERWLKFRQKEKGRSGK